MVNIFRYFNQILQQRSFGRLEAQQTLIPGRSAAALPRPPGLSSGAASRQCYSCERVRASAGKPFRGVCSQHVQSYSTTRAVLVRLAGPRLPVVRPPAFARPATVHRFSMIIRALYVHFVLGLLAKRSDEVWPPADVFSQTALAVFILKALGQSLYRLVFA